LGLLPSSGPLVVPVVVPGVWVTVWVTVTVVSGGVPPAHPARTAVASMQAIKTAVRLSIPDAPGRENRGT
jgi:hypothetical protein